MIGEIMDCSFMVTQCCCLRFRFLRRACHTSYLSSIHNVTLKNCLIWCTICSHTWKSTQSELKSTLRHQCRCVAAYFLFLGDLFLPLWMCTGNPRSRETGVSCADRQRPAAVPLPAWEQGEPEQPHQESPAHHHQVQNNPRRLLWSM